MKFSFVRISFRRLQSERSFIWLTQSVLFLSLMMPSFGWANFIPAKDVRKLLDHVQKVFPHVERVSVDKIGLELDRHFPEMMSMLPQEDLATLMLIGSFSNYQPMGKVNGSKVISRDLRNELGSEPYFPNPLQDELLRDLDSQSVVLDIGCGFGYNSTKALEAGARVFAIDLDAAHIAVLVRDLDSSLLEGLRVSVGKFPDDYLKQDLLVDVVVLGNVIQFMNPGQLKSGYVLAHHLLKPSGKIVMNFRNTSSYGEPLTSFLNDKVKVAKTQMRLGKWLFPTYWEEREDARLYTYHPHSAELISYQWKLAGFRIVEYGLFGYAFASDGSAGAVSMETDLAGSNFLVGKKVGTCAACGKAAKSFCSKCKRIRYCSRDCQVNNHSFHKKTCLEKGKY